MSKCFLRLFEELFPWFVFLRNQRKTLKVVSNSDEVADKAKAYTNLDADCLNKRINEEHERAVKIDEKTSKFTLGLSIFLTVLAAASGTFAKFLLSNDEVAWFVSIVCGIASIYMLSAGIVALGAFKTLPAYGYGTHHILRQKSDGESYLAQALYAQEKMNIIRHLRNETAYQSLRNGFVILLMALIASITAIIYQQISFC